MSSFNTIRRSSLSCKHPATNARENKHNNRNLQKTGSKHTSGKNQNSQSDHCRFNFHHADRTKFRRSGEFHLFGSTVDKRGRAVADVKMKIRKAKAVFLQLKNLWASRDLSRKKNKISLFNPNVNPVLL